MENLNEDRLRSLDRWLFQCEEAAPVGIDQDRTIVAQELFDQLFMQFPSIELSQEKIAAFQGLLEAQLSNQTATDLKYILPHPKWEFLHYLTSTQEYLLHGSSVAQIDQLKPGPQSDWNGKPIRAVFATSDPIWPIFFATLKTESLGGSIRNGGFLVDVNGFHRRYCFFSVHEASQLNQLWAQGTVYIVDRNGFTTNPAPVRFDEWHHLDSVPVVGRLKVDLEDFPFVDSVTTHRNGESGYLTWLQYKSRLSEKYKNTRTNDSSAV